MYLLIVSEHKIDTKNLYDGVLIASSIVLKDEQLLMIGLCTLAWPYRIQGRHPPYITSFTPYQ